ncbi:hypothetical protein D3C78_1722420 [compost metagenome]
MRISTPELLNSAVLSVAAIFTLALGFCFLKSRNDRLSLTVASTRPEVSRSMASLKPCTATTSAPWLCASLPKLLVSVLADFLPFRSSKDLMLVLSSRTISTAADEM